MSADLFLIAHKVRGEPAFDIATKLECPECPEGTDEGFCSECDNTGWWWIIPTSGHRAYPYWDVRFDELNSVGLMTNFDEVVSKAMPSGLPDHYAHRAAPTISLAAALGIQPKPAASLPPLPRRL